MPRGAPAMPLESLIPYYRGARFALLAMKRRRAGDDSLAAEVDRYVAMLDRYSEAAVATFRLKRREQERPSGG